MAKPSGEVNELITEIVKFRDARDWEQFHNPKDLALALSIEAAELNEAFLWKTAGEADPAVIRKELADVLIYALLLAHQCKLDVPAIIREKIALNEAKYPVGKAKGNSKKYSEL